MRFTTMLAALLILATGPAHAALNIITCESEWTALAKEIGGDKVKAESATTPLQDVHYIQARPSLIAKVRRADLVICSGAQLEVGWLPVLVRQAGNPRVQEGQPGLLLASDYVDLLEKPTSVDRALGDIHPSGNPHLQVDPHNIAKVADALAERLESIDSANADYYRTRHDDFAKRWNAATERWTEELAPLKGMKIVVHHRSWIYLIKWAGLEEVGALEPKPGLPPSAAHLADLLAQLKGQHVGLIVREVFQDPKASEWLSGRTGIPNTALPHTVGSMPGTDDLFGMFDVLVKTLLEKHQ